MSKRARRHDSDNSDDDVSPAKLPTTGTTRVFASDDDAFAALLAAVERNDLAEVQELLARDDVKGTVTTDKYRQLLLASFRASGLEPTAPGSVLDVLLFAFDAFVYRFYPEQVKRVLRSLSTGDASTAGHQFASLFSGYAVDQADAEFAVSLLVSTPLFRDNINETFDIYGDGSGVKGTFLFVALVSTLSASRLNEPAITLLLNNGADGKAVVAGKPSITWALLAGASVALVERFASLYEDGQTPPLMLLNAPTPLSKDVDYAAARAAFAHEPQLTVSLATASAQVFTSADLVLLMCTALGRVVQDAQESFHGQQFSTFSMEAAAVPAEFPRSTVSIVANSPEVAAASHCPQYVVGLHFERWSPDAFLRNGELASFVSLYYVTQLGSVLQADADVSDAGTDVHLYALPLPEATVAARASARTKPELTVADEEVLAQEQADVAAASSALEGIPWNTASTSVHFYGLQRLEHLVDVLRFVFPAVPRIGQEISAMADAEGVVIIRPVFTLAIVLSDGRPFNEKGEIAGLPASAKSSLLAAFPGMSATERRRLNRASQGTA